MRTIGGGVARARELTGLHVHNREGEDLGVIEEIVLDVAAGRIAYAVLAFGGFLGIRSKLFAVPWDALRLDGDLFRVDATRQELEEASGFDPDHWPETA
jgi:sporulation protein YlmC with PRC-barrel domain